MQYPIIFSVDYINVWQVLQTRNVVHRKKHYSSDSIDESRASNLREQQELINRLIERLNLYQSMKGISQYMPIIANSLLRIANDCRSVELKNYALTHFSVSVHRIYEATMTRVTLNELKFIRAVSCHLLKSLLPYAHWQFRSKT